MNRSHIFGLLWFLSAVGMTAAPLPISALHPLLADLARQVGGQRVTVFDLVGEGGNPHRFEPRPADLKQMQDSALVLAAGKNQEPYLGRLKETLKTVTVLEVGSTIPSLTVGKDAVYSCCPEHDHDAQDATDDHNALDPHWWHGIENMRRAARIVAQALAEKDPDGKAIYLANATAYGQRLEQLKRWTRSELAKVPRNQRKLVTAHNAFAYFANEFGFEVIAVAGLNKEQNNTPQELAKTIEAVKQSGVQAIFPEQSASDKTVRSIATTTNVKVAEPLISDGNGVGKQAGFEAMIRHNVTVITGALATH